MMGTDRDNPPTRLMDRDADRDAWTAAFLAMLERSRKTTGGMAEGTAGRVDGEAAPAGLEINSGKAAPAGLSLPGSTFHYLRSTPSTNVTLRGIAEQGGSPGTIVLADEQTAGRGRHGRSWFSPPGGGRYCSLLLEPGIAPDRVGWITLAAALALVRSARLLGATLTIKWPNDLECDGRKVAGVLAEMASRKDVIGGIILGTGVNVDWSGCEVPTEVRERGGTLSECAGREVDGDRFMADYLWEIRHLVGEIGRIGEVGKIGETGAATGEGNGTREREDRPPGFASEVMAHMAYLGETVSVRTAGGEISGICTGLTGEGFLELDGGRRIVTGELITST